MIIEVLILIQKISIYDIQLRTLTSARVNHVYSSEHTEVLQSLSPNYGSWLVIYFFKMYLCVFVCARAYVWVCGCVTTVQRNHEIYPKVEFQAQAVHLQRTCQPPAHQVEKPFQPATSMSQLSLPDKNLLFSLTLML